MGGLIPGWIRNQMALWGEVVKALKNGALWDELVTAGVSPGSYFFPWLMPVSSFSLFMATMVQDARYYRLVHTVMDWRLWNCEPN